MLTRLPRLIRLQSLQTGLTAAGLLLAGHALAQPTIQSLAPARNAPAARATSVIVQFSETLRTGSQQALRVYSAQAGGRLAGVATLSGNQLSFTPGTRFRAGEKLWATVDTLVRSTAGRALARPAVWQFSAGGGGTGAFGGGSSSSINTSGRLLLSGDVDGNGHLDVLTLNDAQSDRDGQLALRLNSGRGVLVAVPDQPLTRRAMAATLADVDEDHDLDLVTLEQPTDGSSGFYNVYANDGQGRFGGAGSSSGALGGLAGRGLGLADLNGDGHLDMFFSCNMSGSVGGGAVGVRLNNGRGAFPVQWTYARTGLSTEATVAAADIDNDGDLDVVASHNAAQSVIPVFQRGRGRAAASAGRGRGRPAAGPRPGRPRPRRRPGPAVHQLQL
ncbi:FG-GAP-like repeat-containing protein [Hymenobacter sp. APR13]|uniref:FG-GAP-like repeat-containing protein n=1 Tax=Hymenobacter sp. APR13 TaxID=1356852 RepID=UPI0009DC96C6|nr:FG-GAP-like repeat-containing protein [Hymenobacter sp. APR13]